MMDKLRPFLFTIPANMALITAGSLIFAVGLKAIALPHGFISGGMSGLSLLLYYALGWPEPGVWYLLLNVPIFLVGWFFISRRFFFYSLYGAAVFALAVDLVTFQFAIHDRILAAIAAGGIMGAGSGIILHSVGSAGGNDIIAVVLNQKYNVRMGTFFFGFNLILFLFSFGVLEADLVLYSLVLSFVTTQVLDHVLTIFNQRKLAMVISDHAEAIVDGIHHRLHRGATFLYGRGTYSRRPKRIVLAVLNNYELKRLEELVFKIDPNAFVIFERTFNVLGKGFSRRKVY
jgi:uncharacterized membrane-anchored protein YitT (DUF2179 family)